MISISFFSADNYHSRSDYIHCIADVYGGCFLLFLGQHDNHVSKYLGWDASIPTTSIPPVFMEINPWKFWSTTINNSQSFMDSFPWEFGANDEFAWMQLTIWLPRFPGRKALRISKVPHQFGPNFDVVFLIFLMTYKKRTRFAIKIGKKT